MALYTYECFAVFRFKEEERRKGIYFRQYLMIFLIHFSCFVCICFETDEIRYIFLYIFQLIALYAALGLFRMIYPRANRLVINNMCLLLSVGFVILARLSYDKAMRQFMIVVASLVVALIVPFLVRKLRLLRNLTWLYALAGLVALAVVLIIGQETNGSLLSFSIYGISFQPSEFVKIIFVFFIAGALGRSTDLFQIFSTMVAAAVLVVLLVVARDLGSALIFFIVYILMVYLATGNGLYLLAGGIGGTGAAVLAYNIFSHIQVRVQAWRDPWSVIEDEGYQISQSLFSISNGGWFGLGLFKGNPTAIPYVEDDFVFSAIAEELGLIFAFGLLLVCISCFIMFMNIAMRIRDRFYQLVAFGLGITYIFQVFLTVGGGTKFIPLTGVTLPLISYGGSSVLTTLLMFAIIEGLYMVRLDEGKKRKRIRKSSRNYEDIE
jgi:cell division protein FtsW (lipid II flippase)